jgi:hypothetical protein
LPATTERDRRACTPRSSRRSDLPRFASKQRVNLSPHFFAHINQRRPGAFESFAGEFLRRVNAQLAAAGDHARVSAFSLMNRLRERKAAGLSNNKTVRSAASGEANHG